MNNAARQPAEELFDKIAQFIAESRTLLDAGAMIELAGLDDQVRVLGNAVLQLSQDERLQYADRLQQLLGDMNSLGDSMKAHRDRLSDEIRHLSQHKKAELDEPPFEGLSGSAK
jgi:hypothetical protein